MFSDVVSLSSIQSQLPGLFGIEQILIDKLKILFFEHEKENVFEQYPKKRQVIFPEVHNCPHENSV